MSDLLALLSWGTKSLNIRFLERGKSLKPASWCLRTVHSNEGM